MRAASSTLTRSPAARAPRLPRKFSVAIPSRLDRHPQRTARPAARSAVAVSGGPNERGSGTILITALMAVVTALAVAVAVAAGYVVSAHRVRVAADLAALSGAAAMQLGEDACAAARRNATANSSRLSSCTVIGDQIEFVVQVSVTVAVPHPPAGLPKQLTTSSQAGVMQA